MSVEALILDYGEVLSEPQQPGPMREMARLLGVSDERFADAYWQRRSDYDLGMPTDEYWRLTAESLGLALPGGARLEALVAADVASWTRYRDAMWDLARAFRASGGRTAFLSNGVPPVMARIRQDRPLADWFDVVVVSYEVGLAKPDPRIFTLCLERLGVDAASVLFVDDRAVNTAGAAAIGVQTLTFTRERSVDDVRALLELRE
jgi:putative hydrolase of the HAD superfamily